MVMTAIVEHLIFVGDSFVIFHALWVVDPKVLKVKNMQLGQKIPPPNGGFL